MNGKSKKTHQPIDLHRKSFLVNKKKNHSEVEILSIFWLLEITSPTETYVDGTMAPQKSKAMKWNKIISKFTMKKKKKTTPTCIL